MKCASHGFPRFRSRWASVSITNADGLRRHRDLRAVVERPVVRGTGGGEGVPTAAGPSGASIDRSLNVSLLARSPDQSRWFRRSATVSYTTCGGAVDVTDVWVV